MPNTPADMPSGLTIFAIGFVIMLAFVLLLWAVNVLPGKLREIMSRPPAPAKSVSAGLDQSLDQSAPTSLAQQTSSAPPRTRRDTGRECRRAFSSAGRASRSAPQFQLMHESP